jgi:hypothetical protein
MVRQYPLQNINEAHMFVYGERMGQKVLPGGRPLLNGAVPPNFNQQQAQIALASQNNSMEMLERMKRQESAAARGGAPGMGQQRQMMVTEHDDSGGQSQVLSCLHLIAQPFSDEMDHVSARTLSRTRYMRNHEFMSAVFVQAAWGKYRTALFRSQHNLIAASYRR